MILIFVKIWSKYVSKETVVKCLELGFDKKVSIFGPPFTFKVVNGIYLSAISQHSRERVQFNVYQVCIVRHTTMVKDSGHKKI